MSNQIPDNWPGILSAIIVGAGLVMGWFLRLERRLSGTLSRKEHEAICEKANRKMDADLQQIKDMIEKRDDQSAEFKEDIRNGINTINIRLAVLTRDAVIPGDKKRE